MEQWLKQMGRARGQAELEIKLAPEDVRQEFERLLPHVESIEGFRELVRSVQRAARRRAARRCPDGDREEAKAQGQVQAP